MRVMSWLNNRQDIDFITDIFSILIFLGLGSHYDSN